MRLYGLATMWPGPFRPQATGLNQRLAVEWRRGVLACAGGSGRQPQDSGRHLLSRAQESGCSWEVLLIGAGQRYILVEEVEPGFNKLLKGNKGDDDERQTTNSDNIKG